MRCAHTSKAKVAKGGTDAASPSSVVHRPHARVRDATSVISTYAMKIPPWIGPKIFTPASPRSVKYLTYIPVSSPAHETASAVARTRNSCTWARGDTRGSLGRLRTPATTYANVDTIRCYGVYMADVGVRELKQHLSEYLDRAEAGEVVRVTDRGRPKALLVPLPGRLHLDEGIARGWVTPAESELPMRRQRHTGRRSVQDVLSEDRGE